MFLGWCFTVSITNMLAQKTCISALLVLISTIIVNKGGDPVNIKQNLSKSLKSYRSLERKSLVDFAEKLSIGKTTLQDIESCKANPTLDTVQQIADRLNVSPLSLLSDCYDPSDLHMAQLLLHTLDRFDQLSIEDQEKGVILFDALIRILSRCK